MNNEIAHVNTKTGVKTFYNIPNDSYHQILGDYDREKFNYSELECGK